jgi:predicted nucleic acid-binding protein
MTAVLDASTAVDLLAGTVRRELSATAVTGVRLVAPAVIDLEVINALARMERTGQLTPAQFAAATSRWRQMPVRRLPVVNLLTDVCSLRGNLAIADAFYVALARFLRCRLITSDQRLAGAPDLGIALTLIA